jgi:hypothetical protein
VVIFFSIGIYLRAGSTIWTKHKQLRDFSRGGGQSISVIEDPFTFASMRTTEVHVTSEPAKSDGDIDLSHLGRSSSQGASGTGNYTVNISSSTPTTQSQFDIPTQHLRTVTVAPYPASPGRLEGGNAQGKNDSQTGHGRRNAAHESQSAAWGYAKVSILFFTAMLVTWIPSSANRVFSVMHVGYISPELEYLSAFVLPLQGFWNATIYITTSRAACRNYWSDLTDRFGSRKRSSSITMTFGSSRATRLPSRNGKHSETDSTIELASRSESKSSNL